MERTGNSADNDSRLVHILDAYLADLQAGRRPDRAELLARFPELADDLETCLASLEFIRQAGVRPAAVAPDGPDAEALAPGVLGDYRIVREVGRGGMGVVYEADQLSLGRRVALKVLPFAATLDPRHLQRFKNEAMAAAQLHHGNIVPVYAVGSERGVHYYAMQFVEGRSLAAVVAEVRQASGAGPSAGPAEATPLPEVLAAGRARKARAYFREVARLGIQAAEALEHAHQCGVVHRDVKPANLLVDGHGHLWVTDFGLARSAGNPGLTLTGDVVGTLRYMSPEQALGQHGRVDHHTDIYSLGVSLYELLTLQPAFAGADQQELLRQIDGGTPRRLRRLNHRIPRELETIVLKSMEREPAERYATAQELADDLRRFLDDRPIRARRPTLLARGVRWARRHRTLVGAAAVGALLAVLGLVVSVVLISRERDEAVRQRNEADVQRHLARQAVDAMYTNVAEAFLAHQPGLQPLQRQFLLKALESYEQFAQDRGDDPAVRHGMGRAILRVANIHEWLGEVDKAGPAYERAVAVLGKLAADAPDVPAYREDLADAYASQGKLLAQTGELARAEQVTRQAITTSERLVSEDTAGPLVRARLANYRSSLASLLAEAGRLTEAEPLFRQAAAVLERLAAELPDDPKYARLWAQNCRRLGWLLRRTGQAPEAETWLRRALATQELLTARHPQIPVHRSDLVLTADELGQLLWDQRRSAEAERILDIGFDQRKRLAANFPDVPQYRHDLARGYNNRALLRMSDGRAAEAEGLLGAARALLQELVAECPAVPLYRFDLAKCHTTWGMFYGTMGRFADAEKALREALAGYGRLAAGAPGQLSYQEQVAVGHKNLGVLFARSGQSAEALETYKKARVLFDKLAEGHPEMPHYRFELAGAYLEIASQRRRTAAPREANEADRQALNLLEQLAGAFPKSALYLRECAWQLATAADPDQRHASRAIGLARQATTLDAKNGDGWRALGAAYCRAGNWQEAAAALERSLQFNRGDGFNWYFLAMARWQLGDKAKARHWYDRAIAWQKANFPHDETLQRLREEVQPLFPDDGPAAEPRKEGSTSGK
jgi:serine/threonine protein kinase/predicted Zn-dependent protease